MRPVDKGNSPYSEIDEYQEAEAYLEKQIGSYCSFCEMPICNAPAVEHKESKNSGGALTDWDNLLLGCVYCNSRKGEKIKKGDLDKWIWSDSHNTFLAFTYKDAAPKLNKKYLQTLDTVVYGRAKKTFEDLALDYCPSANEAEIKSKRDRKIKDKRWMRRINTFNVAMEAKQIWLKYKGVPGEEEQLKNIVNQAKGYGFFSVWMMVFEEETSVRNALVQAFPGTDKQCFDGNGTPIRKEGSIL